MIAERVGHGHRLPGPGVGQYGFHKQGHGRVEIIGTIQSEQGPGALTLAQKALYWIFENPDALIITATLASTTVASGANTLGQ